MPGLQPPLDGLQGFAAKIQAIITRLTNLETRQRQSSAITTPGVITQWAGATAPPGALLCNGQSFPTSGPGSYPALHAALGASTVPTISTSPITVIWTGPQSSI